ncbi:iron donor protein CyaY [Buchnera aphidicola]|uniref:Iron-sulfur cluster assembly protein CyaY n=1 Tax=Buchnera aphidicola (Sarucallis kahawaluokalani) TaxID=1241878 RepID=A0A4D6Y9V4_9GAMM|nr:iron donor protein CyaY [Buchnera aphidicola]QCI26179.1 iron donor protein CyaY [Buchnera aphidicola (Sarucallis kahawaluokalani)]
MYIKNIQFHNLYNTVLLNIENYLDHFNSQHDIDYEVNHQIMTILFENQSKIIITKQEVLKQIWLATKKNGYHFSYQNKNWICNRSQENFWHILEKSFYLQGDEKVSFKQFIISS